MRPTGCGSRTPLRAFLRDGRRAHRLASRPGIVEQAAEHRRRHRGRVGAGPRGLDCIFRIADPCSQY